MMLKWDFFAQMMSKEHKVIKALPRVISALVILIFSGWSAFSSKRLFIETVFHRMACSSNAQLFLIFKTVSRISVALLHPKLLITRWKCAFDEQAIQWKAVSMKRRSTYFLHWTEKIHSIWYEIWTEWKKIQDQDLRFKIFSISPMPECRV